MNATEIENVECEDHAPENVIINNQIASITIPIETQGLVEPRYLNPIFVIILNYTRCFGYKDFLIYFGSLICILAIFFVCMITIVCGVIAMLFMWKIL
jgi:hypothetical protein